jgi:SAM-dependent methyltransferase
VRGGQGRATGRWQPHPGDSTATDANVSYRLSKFAERVRGRWLDFCCADGGYAAGLLGAGANEVVGVDVSPERVALARRRGLANAAFQDFDVLHLPLQTASFDGALVNEVLEHVVDEQLAIAELRRVIRDDGVLVVISPNRWFPFEGHGVCVGSWKSTRPTPIVPWLPSRLVAPFMEARNYWPRELAQIIRDGGFEIEESGFVWPVFELYQWLPAPIIAGYRKAVRQLDDLPLVRRFGVSSFFVARPSGVRH